jgi:hypothetical protein
LLTHLRFAVDHEPSSGLTKRTPGDSGRKVAAPPDHPCDFSRDLKKEAKRWLKQLEADDAEARARFDRAYQPRASSVLRDAVALARSMTARIGTR